MAKKKADEQTLSDARPAHRPIPEIRRDLRSAYGEALVVRQLELDAALAAQQEG